MIQYTYKPATTKEIPMARTSLPTNFVGTVYDHKTKVYVSTRKDGSITFGRFNQKGTNIVVDQPSVED